MIPSYAYVIYMVYWMCPVRALHRVAGRVQPHPRTVNVFIDIYVTLTFTTRGTSEGGWGTGRLPVEAARSLYA